VVEDLEGKLGIMEVNIEKIGHSCIHPLAHSFMLTYLIYNVTVKDFNSCNPQNSENDKLGKVLSILNKHHQNLMWLDEQSKEIKVKIGKLNDELRIQGK